MSAAIIKSKYFEAPIIDSNPHYPGYESDKNRTCKFCGTITQLTYGTGIITDSDEEEQGCVGCLIKKKFSISKNTGLGSINYKGQLYETKNSSGKSLTDILSFDRLTEEEYEGLVKKYLAGEKNRRSLFNQAP